MNAKWFQRVVLTSLLLTAFVMAGVLLGGGEPALGQPSAQVSHSSEARSGVTSGPQSVSGTAQPAATLREENDRRNPNPQTYWVVGGLIGLLAVLFILLIWWSSRLEQASYLGLLFRDAVEEIEYRRLYQPYLEKWASLRYHQEARKNPDVRKAIEQRKRQEAEREKEIAVSRPGHGTDTGEGKPLPPPAGTGFGWPEEVEEYATRKYDQDLDNARQRAKDRANRAARVDLNVLRGRGAEFVLEFTAVVVLVFAVTILGLLFVLKSEPIATLLAAIAGYVLGRAASRTRAPDGQGEARSAVRTAEVSELIQAVAGIAKLPSQAPVKEPEEKPETPPSPPT